MDKIVVLDCGGQYAHLIGNRVRRLGVYSEILPIDVAPEKLRNFKGIILSGGPQSVYENDSPQCNPGIFELGIPVLGVCYGMQLMVHTLGGKVEPGKVKEYGPTDIQLKDVKAGMFNGFEQLTTDNKTRVWMSHGDKVTAVTEGFAVSASSDDCEYAAIANEEKKLYGFQFHFEVTHTKLGKEMLENFLDICDCQRDWSIENFIEEEITKIQQKVGDGKVFLMISGGVDSSVAYLMLNKALGADRVYGLFVDTGFMRAGERDFVEKELRGMGFDNLHVYDASKEYFAELKDVHEPEVKRQIIGRLFLEIQKKVVADLNLNPEEWLLGQGTIYPDTIESGGTKHADKIKTHHNRVPEIEELMKQGKIIEPLEQLYKDEVRQVGIQLGLKETMVWRHPFPGPGLAVRCLCAQGDSYPENHLATEEEINQFLAEAKIRGKILPVQSVGVQGDARTYRHACALMTDQKIAWDRLDDIATQLTNRFGAINRALLTVSTRQILELTAGNVYLTPTRISLLQQVDKIVNDFLEEMKIQRDIWQFPVVLIPVHVKVDNVDSDNSGEAIVLRPVCSQEAMTANFYQMDYSLLEDLTSRIMAVPGVSAVFYDISNKPPGTIEWE